MLASLDWIVIGFYFLAVFGIAIWAARSRRGDKSSQDYFLAGRHAGWFVIGASLFASNIGSEHLIGLAGTGAASGLAVAQFEILAAIMLLLLGWLFVPIYMKLGIYTMPEYLERRYSSGARWYLAVVSIIAYVLTKISVTIAAGGIVFEALMGLNFWVGATIIVVATGIYTIFGGLRAVLYTDMLQMFVLIGGSIMVTLLGLEAVGGPAALVAQTEPAFFDLWKPMSDPDFPWTGILLGAPVLGVWYWCTDQFIVQRVLSARNISQARGGTVFAGFLKLTPLVLFVLPGIIAKVLADQGAISMDTPDQALPALMATILPVGLRGLVVAGLLAALMSSLSSVFNSCSTLITVDIYKRLKPSAGERDMVLVGQIATGLLVICGLAWIPLIKLVSGQIYQYLQSIQAYIAPPIAAVFLLGVMWNRVHAKGALVSLWLGFFIGVIRLVLELNKAMLTPGGLVYQFADINFLHFAFFLFVFCAAAHVLVSLFTAPSLGEAALTGEAVDYQWRESRGFVAIASIVLLISVGIIWIWGL